MSPFLFKHVNYLEQITATILNLPTLQKWPALATIISNMSSRPHLDWELPRLAANAVGVNNNQLLVTGSAAIACMQISIILVDDILDDDPRGLHLKVGEGPAANMALALQAGAFELLSGIDLPANQRIPILSLIANMGFQTAFGQQLDTAGGEVTEEMYWSLIQEKSAPFYSAALELGGLIAGAEPRTQQLLKDLGSCFGEIIQIHDDMMDSFQKPANPDWLQNRFNLLLIYAGKANYAEKEEFLRLRQRINDPTALNQAQQILIRNGAVSYGVYHLIQRYKKAKRLLAELPQPQSFETPLEDHLTLPIVFEKQLDPIFNLFKQHNIPIPDLTV